MFFFNDSNSRLSDRCYLPFVVACGARARARAARWATVRIQLRHFDQLWLSRFEFIYTQFSSVSWFNLSVLAAIQAYLVCVHANRTRRPRSHWIFPKICRRNSFQGLSDSEFLTNSPHARNTMCVIIGSNRKFFIPKCTMSFFYYSSISERIRNVKRNEIHDGVRKMWQIAKFARARQTKNRSFEKANKIRGQFKSPNGFSNVI